MAWSGTFTAWGWSCRYGLGGAAPWPQCGGHLVPSRGCSRHLPPPPQALEAAGKFYSPREWNCSQAFAVVLGHDYQQPMAIAQLLPALVDKPYLEAGSLARATNTGMTPSHQLSPQLGPTGVHRGQL